MNWNTMHKAGIFENSKYLVNNEILNMNFILKAITIKYMKNIDTKIITR